MSKVTEAQLTVTGKSRKEYKFNIYTLDTKFVKAGAIYIFTKRIKQSTGDNYNHDFVYCGKTEDLSTRFDNHHKEDCIKKNNANCICILQVETEKERTTIEEDILKGNNFRCNDMLN